MNGRSGSLTGLHALVAFLAYTTLSCLFFGMPLLGSFSQSYVAHLNADPATFMWYLEWWPYAVTHGLNPFITHMVWAPTGINLAWFTSVPGVGLLAAPLTLAFGPVVAYNVVSLLALPVAAWTAYLLCRHLTRSFWPALVAGYVFGFSSYELSHLAGGHLNLILIFPLPLAVYLVLLRLEERMEPLPFVLALAGTLVLQFLFSTEVFATLTMFGAITAALVLALMPADVRFPRAIALIAAAYALATFILTPYLYYVGQGLPRSAFFPSEIYASDPRNLLVPTPVSLSSRLLPGPERIFSGNITEGAAYLGLPLLAVILLYGAAHGRTAGCRVLLLSVSVVWLASLGPRLHIGGRSLPLPGDLLQHLPLIKVALPARFSAYVFLAAAVIAALWLASERTPRWARGMLAGLSVISLLPNVASFTWQVRVDTPPFFTAGLYRQYIPRGGTALVIPYGPRSPSMLWHAQTGLDFRMASGYTGVVPAEFLRWPIVDAFTCARLIPDYGTQLKAFLGANDIRAIVIADGTPGPWRDLFAPLAVPPTDVGGVTVYQVPAPALDAYREAAPLEMARRAALAQFSALVRATDTYISKGLDPAELNVRTVEALGLLPDWGCSVRSINRPATRMWFHEMLWLGPWPGDTLGLGLFGRWGVLRSISSRYGPEAKAVYFPYPSLPTEVADGTRGMLLMVFTRPGVSRLARSLDAPP